MVLTEKIFNKGKSINGSWSKKQLSLLGLSYKSKGWMNRIIGSHYSENVINEFISLKDAHLKNKKPRKRKPRNPRVRKNESDYRKRFVFESKNLVYKQQLKHINWKTIRLFVLRRDENTCKRCGLSQKTGLHVHHILYEGKYIWDTPAKYLVTLCEDCHNKEHDKRVIL